MENKIIIDEELFNEIKEWLETCSSGYDGIKLTLEKLNQIQTPNPDVIA